MKYLCLVYFEQHVLDALSASADAALVRESLSYDDELRKSGHYKVSAALQPVSAARTVRVRRGTVSTTDGPFAETKEILGGFIYIDASDLEEAIRLAGNIPMARLGSIEVRPVQSLERADIPAGRELVPASELARKGTVRFPNESPEYRRAREALLAEEIDLRRHIERVAEQRRALPAGGKVPKDYRFEGEHGPVSLADLFGDKQTLVVYSYMFGPQRERPCPMCTSLLSAWEGEARDVEQRVALAVIARSPIERLIAFKKERGWRDLKLYSDVTGDFSRDYHALTSDGGDDAAFNVFTRRDGTIRHFWSGEMGFDSADPGQDPRGAPDLMPLWTILDVTPEGRGTDWYPKLEYDR